MKYKVCLLLVTAAIFTPSVHCLPNFKSLLNFLKPYERYGDILARRHPSIPVSDETGQEDSGGPLRKADLEQLSDRKVTINGKSYNKAEHLMVGSSYPSEAEVEFGFYLLQNDTEDELLILVNNEGEIVDPEKTGAGLDLSNAFMNVFMIEEYHKSAQALKLQYEIDAPDTSGLSWFSYFGKRRWAKEKVYHPWRATGTKYAVIAGGVWLGYKLYKKLFGKTKKPVPAKGAAKGKKVARAVS